MLDIPTGSAQSTGTVTTELAALHTLAGIADGPHAAPRSIRTKRFADSGFTTSQIQHIVETANGLAESLKGLASQAGAIHSSLKAKTLDQPSAIQQLKNLDQQRDSFLAAAISQLKVDLGSDGWYKFESYLNNSVKPNIVFVP